MSTQRSPRAGNDPARHLNHALAALREAAECLEEATAAGVRPDGSVASALSHVAAARSAIRPRASWMDLGLPERDAA